MGTLGLANLARYTDASHRLRSAKDELNEKRVKQSNVWKGEIAAGKGLAASDPTTDVLGRRKKHELAKRIDRVSRWGLPFAFLVSLWISLAST